MMSDLPANTQQKKKKKGDNSEHLILFCLEILVYETSPSIIIDEMKTN